MIRVWIETAATVSRAGFESVLQGSEDIELVESLVQADVVLREDLPQEFEGPGGLPAVVLADGPLTSRQFRWGVHAILPRDAPVEQIVAALHAASAGLIAIPTASYDRLTGSSLRASSA